MEPIPQKHTIISIDGNIGSGKTTLLSHLKEQFKENENIIFLKEPVDEWSTIVDDDGVTVLEKFYADQKAYSFSFQMMAYISRLAILKDAIQKKPNAIIISERSLFTDKMVFAKMLYDSGNIETINYSIYLKWFDTFIKEFNVDKVIYVKTDPNICHERIVKRSRQGESHIPLDYLINCDKYHNNMLDKTSPECICNNQLVLDGNIDIFANKTQIDTWTQMIKEFIQ
jgi:deoxyguanosine kinase